MFAHRNVIYSERLKLTHLKGFHGYCYLKWVAQSDSLRPHGLYNLWNSPGQNTGVGCHALLQGIFPTQGSNTGLPHCRQVLYQLRHQGSPLLRMKLKRYFFFFQIFPFQEKHSINIRISILDSKQQKPSLVNLAEVLFVVRKSGSPPKDKKPGKMSRNQIVPEEAHQGDSKGNFNSC